MRRHTFGSCAVVALILVTAAARAAEPEAGYDPLVWVKPKAPPAMREVLKGSEYEYEFAKAAAHLLKTEGLQGGRDRLATIQIAHVPAGSNAEQLGLRSGDLLVTLNAKTLWHYKQELPWNKTGAELLEVEADGKRRVIKLKDTTAFEGVRLTHRWNPIQWYLRGNQRDPRWEWEVRVGWQFLYENPPLAETAWHHAIRKGYKPDVLTWWCGVLVNTRQNRMREALEFGSFLPEDATLEANPAPFEFEPGHQLRLALAAGRLDFFADTLPKIGQEDDRRRLAERSRELVRIHEARPAEVRTLPLPSVLAQSMNRVEVLDRVVNTGGPANAIALRAAQVRRPAPFQAPTGSFVRMRSGLDRPTKNAEFIVKFTVQVTDGGRSQFAKNLRIGLIERGSSGDAPISISVESRVGQSTLRVSYGSRFGTDFVFMQPSILMDGKTIHEARVIRVGGWAEAYLNNVRLGAVPVDDAIENMDFVVQATGVTAMLHDIGMFELVDARTVFDSLFGAKIKAAAATAHGADDVALARELLAQARASLHQPAMVTLFYESAYDLGSARAEGYAVAAQAMTLLAGAVEHRRAAAREKFITVLTTQSAAGVPEERKAAGEALIDALIALGDEKLDYKQYAAAAEDYQRAVTVATRIESQSLEELKSKIDLALASDRATKVLALAQQKLLKDPANSAAAEQIIKVYLTEFDDADAAACYASFAKDEQFKTLVPLTTGAIEQVKEDDALKLGEWYLKLARGTTTPAVALTRSAAYLNWYLASHVQEDAQRTKAKTLLTQVAAAQSKLPATRAKPDANIAKLLRDAVLIYTFDQPMIARTPANLTIGDLSGKGNDATADKPLFSPGVAGQCLFLDSNDAIKSKLPVGIAGNAARTLSLWYKTPRSRVQATVGTFVYWGEEGEGKAFGIGPWNGGFMLWGYGEHHDWSNVTPASPDWQHHIITYDGTTVRWYLNGQPLDKTRNHPYVTTDTPLVLGRTPAGWVDELAIFSRALTREEAAQLFRASRAGLAKALGK